MKRKFRYIVVIMFFWGAMGRVIGQGPVQTPDQPGHTREIILQGTYNFRDIGGYTAADGRHIKWGKIYRSAVLSNLTAEDLQLLQLRRIGTVLDFRGPVEVALAPDKLPESSRYLELPAGSETDGPDDWKGMAEGMLRHTEAESDQGATGYYRNIASFGKRYKPMFDALLNTPGDSALVIHCAGGKDRTGIAAAFIEYALGVDRKQILEDYVLTNKYRERYNAEIASLLHLKYGVPLERAGAYGLAKPGFIEATFSEIDKQYGSMQQFLETEMGLNEERLNKLRSLYLE